jgi:beta-N-acetylhexosaminidase
MIQEGVPAIMSAHLAFPNTPGGVTPASLSRWFLTDLLRDQMGFNGLIITDDLMMNGALTYTRSLSRAAKMALEAGNDIIMLSTTPFLHDPVWTYLLSSMRNEPEFRERVRDACRRVLTLKLEHLRGENKVPFIPDLQKIDEGITDPEGTAFFLSLAARSATVMDNNNVFPITPENSGRVLLAGNFTEFFNAGRRAFPNAATFRFNTIQDGDELVNRARNADTIIFLLSNRNGLRILQRLQQPGRRVIVLSILNPVYLDEAPWVDGAVAVYSFAPESFIAGFSAMLGRIPGEGVFPFTPIGRHSDGN